MRPTLDQLQSYLGAAERGPVDRSTAAWARRVLEEALQRADRADRISPAPKPERVVYHTR